MIKAICSSETSMNFYRTTREHIPEDVFFKIPTMKSQISQVLIGCNVRFMRRIYTL
jgi:hypothetical protein